MTTDQEYPQGLLIREVDGEVLVLDSASDQVHQLNESASLIWRLHSSGAEVKEIAEALQTAYALPIDEAQRDTSDALNKFRELRLLR